MRNSPSQTVYLLSGGVGASGEQLLNTALAQFPDQEVRLIVIPHIRYENQIDEVLEEAQRRGALVAHTMVNRELHEYLTRRVEEAGVKSIDLMGGVLNLLEKELGIQPIGEPGRYRQLKRDYFERVAAMEYAMAHDDGRDPAGWASADIVLVGISRVGKTPLSLYLSVLGWKTANYPLVLGIDPPQELLDLDPKRILGLTIEPGLLILLRRERQQRIGAIGEGIYTDPESVYEEVDFARSFFKKQGCSVIDVTDKPLESTADEIIHLISSRFQAKSRRG